MPARLGRGVIVVAIMLTIGNLLADSVLVDVSQYVMLGDVQKIIVKGTAWTGEEYESEVAPEEEGWIFTHWEISTGESMVNRDWTGRALDVVLFIPYQTTCLLACYLPETTDTDGDGIPDGHELYWYGTLDYDADSDTDGDGFSFAAELENGTNPHFVNFKQRGLVRKVMGDLVFLNPYSSVGYVVRSDSEGLLGVSTNYVIVGQCATTPTLSPNNSTFAYWTVDGIPARDAFGRALDGVSVPMGDAQIEFVAISVLDEIDRMKLYWYGTTDVSLNSDTDGDGITFAEELLKGTNPLLRDSKTVGGLSKASSELTLLNPNGFSGWIVEGLGGATTNIVANGDVVTSPDFSPYNSEFAYWTVNGVAVRDAFGRAIGQIVMPKTADVLEMKVVSESDEMVRMKLYWYGVADISMDSDTDGDGFTFAEELKNGTNPHFPNYGQRGSILKAMSNYVDVNGQNFEQVMGAIVEGHFTEFFTSPIAGNEARSETFGDDLQPIVWDLNGDGLFDLVLVYKGGYKTFINVGYHGNPEFEERKDVSTNGVELAMNDISRLAGLMLDVAAPEDALSATTNGAALLVSDSAGRIWYYEGTGESSLGSLSSLESLSFALQHKVWGGSHAGFAEGLRLAAVDWDEDGDLDCLAGTAAGKLMLLRDPKVGRPANLKAEAGVDTVVLTWDPNQQSRIRGYRLYRASGESEDFARIAEPQLPTHRDQPPEITTYDYKVSSVSRFYTAGNSTPTITESPATEPVRATLGGVAFDWHDVNAKVGERVEVVISIENALNYNVVGKIQTVTYDPEYLMPVKVVKSGLTENIEMTDSAQDGSWTVTMTSGVLPAGSGRFLTFVFDALKEGETTVGGATVTISAASHYFLGDVDGNGEVNELDLRLLAKLKSAAGRKYTADQLKAGDFNSNGKLDNADYQALRALLKEAGVL